MFECDNKSDLSRACRSCLLNSENMTSLYDQFSIDMCVADAFVFVTSLEFSGDSDGLPTQICPTCISELNLSYSFVSKCHKSHKNLQNHNKNASDFNQTEQTTPFHHVDIKLEIDEYSNDYQTTLDPITTECALSDPSETHSDPSETQPDPCETQPNLDVEVIKHEIDDGQSDIDDYINYKNESDADEDTSKMAAKKHKMAARKRDNATINSNSEVKIGVLNDCKQCDIQFATYELLLTHYRLIEHDTIGVSCRFCAELYEPKDLYDHTQLEHKSVEGDANCDSVCTICGLHFEHKGNLKRHMATHTGEKPHVCEVCNKSFNRKESMTYHMLSHTGKQPYLFPVTDKFINKEQITHKVVQVKRTHYSCAICDKTFNHKGKVSRHMLTHTGQKPYSCDVCDKSFNQKENLSRHILTHTGQKPHACTVCERSFTHKENLTYHMITHSDEKPYACEHCGKSFVQKTKLNRHLLTHSTQRLYSCDVCDRSFIKIGNLNRHMITHTT